MKDDNLPETFSQVFSEVIESAEDFGIDADTLQALLIQPLIGDHFNQTQEITNQRMDALRLSCRNNASKIMRLLSKLSLLQFIDFVLRLQSAQKPWEKTRYRIVLCGDDSLLVHAEESNQPDVVNIWSTLYKTYRKAHDLIVLGVTVGPGRGNYFFPLWVELWRQPGMRKKTRPQRMASALYRLNEQLKGYGLSLSGIDFATDNAYLSPVVGKAIKECKLIMTTKVKSTQNMFLLNGEELKVIDIRNRMKDKPIRYDPRAGVQAYYFRCEVVHPYLGKGTLVIQRRKLRSGKFQYHYHFSQHQNAKGITVLQIAARRWPVEVFFRESKQHLGMGHLPYRKWSSMRGHVAVRALLYFIFYKIRRKLRFPKKQKTVGALKHRFKDVFMEIFLSLFPLNQVETA
jgi:hypothetical protein